MENGLLMILYDN